MEAGDMMTRQELIIALTNAKENLGPLTDIESQEALAYNAYFRDKKYYETEIVRGTSHIGDFLLGYLLMGFVVFLLFCIFGESGAYFGVILAFILPTIYAGMHPSMKTKKYNKKLEDSAREFNSKYERLEQKRITYVSNNSEIFGFLPPAYVTPIAISEILDYLENMRADSLKEAINLYEQNA